VLRNFFRLSRRDARACALQSVLHRFSGNRGATRCFRAQDKRNPDGLHMHCKICRKRKSAPNASEVAVTEKACSRCGEQKGASSFYVDKQAQCGLEAQCKECRRASRRLVTEVHWRVDRLCSCNWSCKTRRNTQLFGSLAGHGGSEGLRALPCDEVCRGILPGQACQRWASGTIHRGCIPCILHDV